jgi:Domain of unknown function (DUF397)
MTNHPTSLTWRKSSYSSSNSNCVEVAVTGPSIAVRHSKDPLGPVLVFGAGEWRAFVTMITAGELDPN